MIRCLQIYVIGRNILFASPTVIDDFDEFLCYVEAETIVPTVIKPVGQFLGTIAIGKLGIEFALLGQSRIGKVTTTHYGLYFIEVIRRAMG